MRFTRVFELVITLIIFSIQFATLRTYAAGEPPCAPKFQTFGKEGADWASDLDRLVAFETEIDNAESVIQGRIQAMGLPTRDAFRITNAKHLEVMEIRSQYEVVSDDLLSEDVKRIGDMNSRISKMRTQLEQVMDVAQAKPVEISFKDLIETPAQIRVATKYDVPQASGVAGSTSAKKLSVSFTREVLDYFAVDLERGSRFLRAIQKGYIGTGSGSGIVRITDHHEALVEIKVIGGKEGNQRLLGCRRADGYIEILKVYEKRNEGGGGSLKHFAELCE